MATAYERLISYGRRHLSRRPTVLPGYLLLDWEAARSIEVPDTLGIEETGLLVPYEVRKVLPLVDGALHRVVQRLLALPLRTTNSCSGHLDDPTPYLAVKFIDPAFGRELLSGIEREFGSEGANPFGVSIQGATLRPLDSFEFQRHLPVEVCLEHSLDILIHFWMPEDSPREELVAIWERFCRVLDRFDHQGGFDGANSEFPGVSMDDQAPHFRALEQAFILEHLPELREHFKV